MQIEFLESFSRDLDKITQRKVKDRIVILINKIEEATTISEIKHLKKLSGENHAYRLRLGEYRIGMFIEKNIIELARVAHRKDIYKIFP